MKIFQSNPLLAFILNIYIVIFSVIVVSIIGGILGIISWGDILMVIANVSVNVFFGILVGFVVKYFFVRKIFRRCVFGIALSLMLMTLHHLTSVWLESTSFFAETRFQSLGEDLSQLIFFISGALVNFYKYSSQNDR